MNTLTKNSSGNEPENVAGKSWREILEMKERRAQAAEAAGNAEGGRKIRSFLSTVRDRISRVDVFGVSIEPEATDLAPELGGVAYLQEGRTEMNRDILEFTEHETDESIGRKALTAAAVYIHEKTHHLMHDLGVVCREETHEGLTQAATENIDSDAAITGAYRSEVADVQGKTNIHEFVQALRERNVAKVKKAVREAEGDNEPELALAA